MDEIQNVSFNNKISKEFVSTEDQISFKEFLRFLLRNRKLIFLLGFFGSILGVLIALNSKRIYEGQFQIVLEEDRKSLSNLPIALSSQLNTISNLTGIDTNNKELKTQIAILKSPSVLMKVFEYVKAKKMARNSKKFEGMRFKDWRKKSFDFKLEKGTEVLNLAYRDIDKEIILPVLTKISNIYQNYTGEENSRETERSIDYFEKQIAFYKNKIPSSKEELIKYGENNNLSLLKNNIDSSKETLFYSLNVEEMKNSINAIDQKLINLRSIYKENDKEIQNLLRDKKVLLEASKRPQGVVIKYKQLLDEVFRDRETLLQLENNLRILKLQQARNSVPWRLITKPTLLPKPVAPKRRDIAAIFTLIGLLSGGLSSLVLEKRKGTIFSAFEIKSQINLPLIAELNCDSKNSWLESLYLIISNILSEYNEKIGLLITNDLDLELTKKVENRLEKFIKNEKLIVYRELSEISKLNKSIMITALGQTKKSTIVQIKNGILFKENSFLGFLVLNKFII